jgi:putative ABC transport system substrate-binding protein
MKRREVITLLSGVATWPVMARAQQPRAPRIGVLMVNDERDPDGQERALAFGEGLRDLGWTEGHNIQIDYRWGVGTPERARTAIAQIVSLSPDVILANGTPATVAVHQATRSIPVVFVVVADPVGARLVDGLAKPGGNITGFSTFEPEIGSKWLELLNEISPGLQRVAGLSDPSFEGFTAIWRTIENSAQRMGLSTSNIAFRDPTFDIEPQIAALAKDGRAGLIVLPTPINNLAHKKIISLAMRYRLPAVYPFRPYAVDGGLISYGFDPRDLFRRAATYVDHLLKGEKPADLPVQAPTKFDLIINLKTAKGLSLNIPPNLLARADEVIE